MVDLVQTEHFPRGAVELVMVDLQRGKRRVEGELDVGCPRRILEGVRRHGWELLQRSAR